MKNNPLLKSFAPLADDRSSVLILGTMPGPMALEKKEYYGYTHNQFWRVLPDILGERPPVDYVAKLELLKRNRVALWDVIRSCRREGALDAAIECVTPNALPALLKKFPGIHTVFLNGKTSEALYRRHFGKKILLPAYCLPSTSPAHASMSYEQKREKWALLVDYLRPRKNWC
jgi:hypoxanthine-DNA glycosylase